MTIRRTLQNAAGFPVHAQRFYVDRPQRPLPIAETLRCFGTEISKPGERYVYSNIGYVPARRATRIDPIATVRAE